MKIEQVVHEDIPRSIYRKGFSFSFPGGTKEIYYKLDKDLVDKELWEIVDRIRDYPRGIMIIKALGQSNYLMVLYYPKQITDREIFEFVKDRLKM